MTIEYTELLKEVLNKHGAFGDTYTRFYNYSFRNQIILWLQGVKEPVATYKAWQSLGRQVKKGSKAKEIMRPISIYAKDSKGNILVDENGNKEVDKILFKYVKCIFTYSDTDGEELPKPEFKAWSMEQALKQLKIEKVEYKKAIGNAQGYSINNTFAINPLAKYQEKTILHELAHIVLGHTKGVNAEHKGIKEFQAESTAYLLAKELELKNWNDAESRAYIQDWLDGEKPQDKYIEQILTAVNKILQAGRA